jgi:two-component system, OmpR family, response regulator
MMSAAAGPSAVVGTTARPPTAIMSRKGHGLGQEFDMPFPLDQIELLRWPGDGARRAAAAERGTPRLLLVADGAPPPRLDPGEDWIRIPADEHDLLARMQRLAAEYDRRRRPPYIEADVVLRYAGRTVVLSGGEGAVLRPLIASFGELVTWDVLRSCLWPDAERTARAMSSRIFRVRARIEPIGLTIYTIRGRGVVLDHDDRPTRVGARPS